MYKTMPYQTSLVPNTIYRYIYQPHIQAYHLYTRGMIYPPKDLAPSIVSTRIFTTNSFSNYFSWQQPYLTFWSLNSSSLPYSSPLRDFYIPYFTTSAHLQCHYHPNLRRIIKESKYKNHPCLPRQYKDPQNKTHHYWHEVLHNNHLDHNGESYHPNHTTKKESLDTDTEKNATTYTIINAM